MYNHRRLSDILQLARVVELVDTPCLGRGAKA